jgi:hypothetical protein
MTGIGSQYIWATMDANKQYFDGSKTCRVTLPKGIPQESFWSLTLYDNQLRSMLDTPQRYPRAAARAIRRPPRAPKPMAQLWSPLGQRPEKPNGIKDGNWIQTMPGKGWFVILRLYSPLQPFFDKSWRPGEIEEMK